MAKQTPGPRYQTFLRDLPTKDLEERLMGAQYLAQYSQVALAREEYTNLVAFIEAILKERGAL